MESLKTFYKSSYEASNILENTFKKNIDLGEFNDFLASLFSLTDVDIQECNTLIIETLSWKSYFNDLKYFLEFYIDKFIMVDDCYNSLIDIIKNEKALSKDLLIQCKIKSNTVGDILMELIQKQSETEQKIKILKKFSQCLDSYISYLNKIYYNLSGISRGYMSRYWKTID